MSQSRLARHSNIVTSALAMAARNSSALRYGRSGNRRAWSGKVHGDCGEGVWGEDQRQIALVPAVQHRGCTVRARERADLAVGGQAPGELELQAIPHLQQQVVVPGARIGGDVGLEPLRRGSLGERLLKESLLGQELVDEGAL